MPGAREGGEVCDTGKTPTERESVDCGLAGRERVTPSLPALSHEMRLMVYTRNKKDVVLVRI